MTTTLSSPPPARLLDPRTLAAVARMELVAHQVMDGYISGLHRSPHIGFALDFAQHRQYAPGDDIKRIDWRVYAKADRYYIKQYEVTTSLKAHLIVDASGSMRYKGAHDALSKFRYAQFLAACLAYLVLHQQDSAGLITFDSQIRDFIPARSATSHLLTITRALDNAKPRDESSIAALLHDIAERVGHRQMVILISDLFDNAEKLLEAFHHLRHKRHEVLILQTLAEDELTFPFKKFTLFENLESVAQKIRLDPVAARAAYLGNLQRHLEKLRLGCEAMQINYALFRTNEPLDKALTAYLARRMGSR
ncbi:MAG TPA: DUF58 domain-containing protein [Phycisphaerae bacterium]|nr:DUF58 domain-containing protein [Phycisphaerae bacterium]